MQSITTILNEIKKRNLNVSEIARITGIPGSRLSKWVKGPYKPKAEDADKLKEWAKVNLEEVVNNSVNEPPAIYNKVLSREDKLLDIVSKQQESILLLSKQIVVMQGKITSLEDGRLGNVGH